VNAPLPCLPASTLPLAPDAAVEGGELCAGRYVGRLPRVDWSSLKAAKARPDWWLRCHHKRWTYVGIATPTEAAALGLMATVALVAANGQLTLPVLLRAFEGTVRTTCMIMLIIIAAFFLNFVMVSIGLVKAVTDSVLSLGLPPLAMLLAIIVFYLILGCFMETLSMMIATTPVVVPVITAMGYSPVWWGIIFVILMEAALITPPVGLNLYVVQSVRRSGPFSDLCVGALPFVGAMIIMIGILIVIPDIALWLPSVLQPKK